MAQSVGTTSSLALLLKTFELSYVDRKSNKSTPTLPGSTIIACVLWRDIDYEIGIHIISRFCNYSILFSLIFTFRTAVAPLAWCGLPATNVYPRSGVLQYLLHIS